MNRKQLIVVWVIVVLSISIFCHCEEPELKKVVDSQGNVYSVDEKGDIYSDGVPNPSRQPASVENLTYYFNESMMLEKSGHLDDAYKMYSEILSLSETDEFVKNAQYVGN
jgi:hypothetical protein